ncbi:MAG TPA: enoyl-CoA hydratase/isomerase family protein [Pyrinomonadaceae bacterium]|jgi:enoyl-CoA hydratase/carnithine racemase|nr:enoyl-CoA hydratase/isomerase family protein [Pyrinomonadaceae bacterium]
MTVEQRDADTSPVIVVDDRPPLAIIRLNRPAERNPLSITTLERLESVVSSLTSRLDIQAIIFTGTDDVFASGANIRELRKLTPASALELARRGQMLFQKISDARQLTIAAINGYCMGGGLDLALSCDLRYASPGAVFAHPGARLGIITGWGGTQRLPRLIGMSRALEILLTGCRVNGKEALEIGLVNHVGDPVLDYSCQVVSKLF